MITRDELDKDITRIIAGARQKPTIIMSIPFLPDIGKRYDELLERCVDLQKELLKVRENTDEILELGKKVYEIETVYARLHTRLMLIPSTLFIYFGIAVVFLIIYLIDLQKLVTKTLGVETPEKLITFGLAGAFLYLATSRLSKLEVVTGTGSQIASVAVFTIRLFYATIVPVVLVALFFKKEGEVNIIKISPELLSFGCGYSAKLVVDIFNKIVDKVSKMIEAL